MYSGKLQGELNERIYILGSMDGGFIPLGERLGTYICVWLLQLFENVSDSHSQKNEIVKFVDSFRPNVCIMSIYLISVDYLNKIIYISFITTKQNNNSISTIKISKSELQYGNQYQIIYILIKIKMKSTFSMEISPVINCLFFSYPPI